MSGLSPVLKPVSQIELAPGSAIAIPNVNWQEFETILAELGDKRSARIAYFRGLLEIMVPLPEHEKPKEIMSDIVKLLLKLSGRSYEPFGSTTFKREGTAGIEPDACFYIQNYRAVIGRRRLEPDDPPPDLAIESDVTSKTVLSAYEAIGVPEVWVYDRPKLTIFVFTEGGYCQSEISPTFPDINIVETIPQAIARSWEVGHVGALEEFRQAIDDN